MKKREKITKIQQQQKMTSVYEEKENFPVSLQSHFYFRPFQSNSRTKELCFDDCRTLTTTNK